MSVICIASIINLFTGFISIMKTNFKFILIFSLSIFAAVIERIINHQIQWVIFVRKNFSLNIHFIRHIRFDSFRVWINWIIDCLFSVTTKWHLSSSSCKVLKSREWTDAAIWRPKLEWEWENIEIMMMMMRFIWNSVNGHM